MTISRRGLFLSLFAVAGLNLLIACGGSSGGGAPGDSQTNWTPGTFVDASVFQDWCEIPRSGTDINGNSFADQQGSALHEKHFLRSWSNDTYLWYNEIPDTNPALASSISGYFEQLKTAQLSPSGNPKDKFHFTYPSDIWLQLTQSGISAGYGIKWTIVNSAPPREVRVAYNEPGSPAGDANISRGLEVISVDGVDVINATSQTSVDTINAGLFPESNSESHTFVFRNHQNHTNQTITLISAQITAMPVQNVDVIETSNGKVGYLQFNAHIETAEAALVEAITSLDGQNISDLVLDLRYNGGGLLAIASQTAYMVAGDLATRDKTFEQMVFNNKYLTTNPVTGRLLAPTPFYSESLGFSLSSGQALPTLDLPRVFILSTARTCSASEAIINGLNGIGVQVVLIGDTTCGKPYGFYPQDNCGTTYFSIQFRGENHAGFGDYSDGFSPANVQGTAGTLLDGCAVADDFSRSLGDPQEAQLAAALAYRQSNSCPPPSNQLLALSADKQAQLDGSLFNSKRYIDYIRINQIKVDR